MNINTFIKRLQRISEIYGEDITLGDFGNEIDFIKDKNILCTLYINDDSVFCNIQDKSIEGKDL